MDTIFVFYENTPEGSWKYRLPKAWDWIGSGSTTNPKYPHEEQFSGPRANKKAMLTYLDKFFSKLKAKGVVKRYKIRQSYSP